MGERVRLRASFYPIIFLYDLFTMKWVSRHTAIQNFTKQLIFLQLITCNVAIFAALTELRNVQEIVSNAYVLGTFCNGALKYYYLFMKNAKMFDKLLEYCDHELLVPQNKAEETSAKKNTFFSWLLFAVVLLIMSSAGWGILLITISNYELSAKAYLPVVGYNYAFHLFFEFFTFCIIGYANFISDAAFTIFMLQICLQCDNLAASLAELDDDGEDFNLKLRRCVQRHKLIVKWSKEIESTFSVLILGQYTVSVINLCQTLCLISSGELGTDFLTVLVLYLLTIVLELFLYCWIGNNVIQKSENISYSLFCSKWYQNDNVSKKALMFFMIRLQQPIQITVAKLFPNDLKTFLVILKSSWSYYTMLSRFNNK